MADEEIALARRLYLHVKDGGSVTAMDLSRLVAGMEALKSQRDVAQAERLRLAGELAKTEKAILPWIDDVGWLNAEYARHTAALKEIAGVSMSQFARVNDLAEYQRAVAAEALKEDKK